MALTARSSPKCGTRRYKKRKQFFFEKKNQKTFIYFVKATCRVGKPLLTHHSQLSKNLALRPRSVTAQHYVVLHETALCLDLSVCNHTTTLISKSFLVLFFKKERLPSLSPNLRPG
jgi:hypothetical protein